MENPQMATHLLSFNNSTKANLTNKNKLALTPQESEYFYDEYVDYPFNESLVEGNVINGINNKDKEQVQLTTKIPHNISGK